MYGAIEKINNQIAELEKLKNSYQQPIQNIINTNVIDFEARYLNENEKVEDLLVQRKTCFIDLKKGYIAIKELNGEVKRYDIVIPKDPKDLKIEELERKLREYESAKSNKPTKAIKQSYSNYDGNAESEPTTSSENTTE